MKSRKELKKAARNQLHGNWIWAICLSLFAALIWFLANDLVVIIINHRNIDWNFTDASMGTFYTYSTKSTILNIIISVIFGLLFWGVYYTILEFRDTGNKTNIFKGMFSAYTKGKIFSSFRTYLVEIIFVLLWSILFIIPGIIKGYSYAMTVFIMKDLMDSGKKPKLTEAIAKSRHLMSGRKMDLFILDLSFIGWWLLALITCGIALIWITPYYRQTIANFYRSLAGDQFLK